MYIGAYRSKGFDFVLRFCAWFKILLFHSNPIISFRGGRVVTDILRFDFYVSKSAFYRLCYIKQQMCMHPRRCILGIGKLNTK